MTLNRHQLEQKKTEIVDKIICLGKELQSLDAEYEQVCKEIQENIDARPE